MEDKTVKKIIVSQYKASLGMLRSAIENTPEEYWNTDEYDNPIWQIACHALWGTKYYLAANPESYTPFQNAIEGAESLGGTQDWENPDEGIVLEGHHTKNELLSFINVIENMLHEAVDSIPLENDSGFEWYPYSRLELHLSSIRHLQHHTAQIIERLKAKGVSGFLWWADQNAPQVW